MTDLITTPHGTLFDYEPQAVAALIRPTDPAQVTVFDAIAEAEQETAADPLAAVRDAFDAIWRGDRAGFGHAKLEAAHTQHVADLHALEAGTIRPETIVGRGVAKPKTQARAWLTRRIQETARDLATFGRSNTVNIGNVLFGLPAGHPAKQGNHRVRFESDDRSGLLFGIHCACADSEYGFTRVSERSARDVERHMAGLHVLGRAAR